MQIFKAECIVLIEECYKENSPWQIGYAHHMERSDWLFKIFQLIIMFI